eukprot:CAMPEP_0194065562 /NCGR_PEP_ID=MMETSP0009_2-20130614/85535_1 /TAXON_ID=210454 /ORGANISM="Grammatophora oceanica, Strain CCMP 410" /LENGTH=384 /DNA_ID=CAMNT_0038718421 /DNA_START=220 /DNA_END=1374 /DNA_ORIENTATION=-
MASTWIDFAVVTIFAREFLEGTIIIGEYRTIIFRCDHWPNPEFTQKDALKTILWASVIAVVSALVVIAAVAIPLAILSKDFDDRTSKTIEGVSKIVAAVCLLQLSLKLPKWLGVYARKRKKKSSDTPPPIDSANGSSFDNAEDNSTEEESNNGLTKRSIFFNVAWNIWREVAECGVFLIPFFLSGEGVKAVPLSAVIGSFVGLALGVAIYFANKTLKDKRMLAFFMGSLLLLMSTGLFSGYFANKTLKDKRMLAFFMGSLLLLMSTGLFSGGCHNLEKVFGMTKVVWTLEGDFWSVDRLPMTVFKPFGYSDYRTVLQIATFWGWLFLGLLLHYRKWRQSQGQRSEDDEDRDSFSTPGGSESSAGSAVMDEENGQQIDVVDATPP